MQVSYRFTKYNRKFVIIFVYLGISALVFQKLLEFLEQGKAQLLNDISQDDTISETQWLVYSGGDASGEVFESPNGFAEREPGPIRIAEKSANFVHVDVAPLCQVLSNPNIATLPVVIFSVNGNIRCGKSFLLNQALKYLKFGRTHPKDWIDCELPKSFDWESRYKSCTEGIQIWSEPFILEGKDGYKIALILMDNQGLQDSTTDTKTSYKLFCLSNLISSVFTYCDSQAHMKNYLESLHEFLEFSKSVDHDGRAQPQEKLPYTFGNLILHFRDFRFIKDFPCDGCKFFEKQTPGVNLYTHIFEQESNITWDVKRKRQAILEYYDKITVCTMRGPGNREPDDSSNKYSYTWDPEYLDGITKFIKHVFCFDFLSQATKQICGERILAGQYVPYVRDWAKTIMEKEYNIVTMTNLEATRRLYYNRKVLQSMDFYQHKLEEYKADQNLFVDIFEFHKVTLNAIEEEFWSHCEYGNWKDHYLTSFQEKIRKLLGGERNDLLSAQGEKRKVRKIAAATTATVSTGLCIGGSFGAALATSQAIGLAGLLTASTGGLVVVVAVGLFAAWYWQDRKERDAIRELTADVE